MDTDEKRPSASDADEADAPAAKKKRAPKHEATAPPPPPIALPSVAAIRTELNGLVDRTRLLPDLNAIIAGFADHNCQYAAAPLCPDCPSGI
jgi:hypothetical protein